MHVYFPSFFLFFLLGYSLTYNLDLEVGVGLWSRSNSTIVGFSVKLPTHKTLRQLIDNSVVSLL